MRKLAAVVLLLSSALIARAQNVRHPFTFDDAATLRHAQAVAVSPDGKSILYRVGFGGQKGPGNTEWYLIPASGGDARHLTIPEQFKPSGFTADGKALYGTLKVNNAGQLATLPLAPADTPAAAAATPVPLTALPKGIHSALLSPDGKRYAVLADPRLPDPLADIHNVIEAEPTSLYIVNADGTGGAWWCPTLKDIAEEGIAWSPDGASVAALSQTPKIGFHYIHTNIDVCTASATRHIANTDNASSNIGWINGGNDLVFLSTTTQVLTPDHVWTVSASGGAPQDRTPDLPASAIHLYVDPKGNAWVWVARGVQTEIDSLQRQHADLNLQVAGWDDLRPGHAADRRRTRRPRVHRLRSTSRCQRRHCQRQCATAHHA